MAEDDSTPFQAQQAVVEWGWYGDSYSKIGFLKQFCQSLGLEEIHHVKCILTKIQKQPENRRRQWVGPNPTDSFKRQKRESEDSKPRSQSPSPLSRPLVSRYGEEEQLQQNKTALPVIPSLIDGSCKPWWKRHQRADVVGYDAEHVHLKGVTGSDRIRGGKVAVVNSVYETIYNADIYHAPGSFLCNPIMVQISGIHANSLVNGVPMKQVTREIGDLLKTKLVITVDGSTDFSSIDLRIGEFQTFNLQAYYKRTHPSGIGTENMSLRDIYFLEFGEDFQGLKTHSPEKDAEATVRCFLEGYVKRNIHKITQDNKKHFEIFDEAIKLKSQDKKQLFYCNTERLFKDANKGKCNCVSCTNLFFRK
jgi:hypothetical protein